MDTTMLLPVMFERAASALHGALSVHGFERWAEMGGAERCVGLAVTAAVLAALAGCPGDDDGASDGGAALPSAGAADFSVCDAHRGWTDRCAQDPDFGSEVGWADTECRDELPWRYTMPAFIDAVAECLRTLPCDGSDDRCTEEGFAAIGITSEADVADDELFQRCLDLAHSCDEFIDDSCTAFLVFTQAGRDAAAHCVDVPCERFRACLSDPEGE